MGQTDSENYATCATYMEGLMAAFEGASSMADVREVAYKQYVDNPAGPYVFCWEKIPIVPSDDVNAMVLTVHPYIEPGMTLAALQVGQNASYIAEKREMILENIQQPTGTLFNYTESFNQPATEGAVSRGEQLMVTEDASTQQILGFIEEDPKNPKLRVDCGCRFTGVPEGNRLAYNTNGADMIKAWASLLCLLLLGMMI